ncbi:hypothetical protein A2W67_00715 [Candidatus Nomurabacteria bacterium RIFCSPLOWO2_02_40_28]|uniref:Uncharacterized protein n=2 Tax=Candidatus Nomuraibacteriota TaxID=1752729 RepID=A0A837HUC9_9BACT|nr:MAG: hypothetical protein UT27_C0003G0028 [Candidatus Nomurabacteria bacterium GW2011_GWD2_39_12]KKR20759.1 MAG: hypothetical protein UT51_C0002G0194 [Candidatus Nomurabacteria bacterium GW2011_GWC2_39_41]KKR36866.1 MAG: hypothetical protein UT70_C0005G0013 [Candidatus Nomurabacteria bacterium GW2011_GWE2_40_10]KKR38560.1 MAG: hypothetical protein UT73_C0002G0045 [Candidatus Nomurabacteria bacterium GW2011_GWB1_40_11]KKR40285.1 MAG: hypothetical protein UT74_C0001G0019 [Parcubacteria group b
MSKRNFVLLVIILSLVVVVAFGFLYFRQPADITSGDTEGTNFFSQFNPFGGTGTSKPPVTKPPVDVSGYVPPTGEEIQDAKLKKVSSMPIAGFTVFTKERIKETALVTGPEGADTKTGTPKTEFVLALRYVEKSNGIIYQTFADKIEERKFSKTIIPKIYDAYFGSHGESVIMRYLKADDQTIETFVGNLPKENLGSPLGGENELKGSFLPVNIKDVSISPDTLKAFYLFSTGENMVGTVLNFSTNKKIQIFDSPFTEWLSWWPNEKIITLTTKPSALALGYVYGFDQNGKNFSNILGNINGLTTLTSPNGKLILYGDSSLAVGVYHTDTRISDFLGVKTLPEKCVWSGGSDFVYCAVPKLTGFGLYPDSWYQGEVSFSDQIWKVDIKTGNGVMILDPVTVLGGEDVDGIKLTVDQGENYLFFVNKKDSFLWELSLK